MRRKTCLGLIHKAAALLGALALGTALTACGKAASGAASGSAADTKASESEAAAAADSKGQEEAIESLADSAGGSFKVGICNYVDDASLNQIVDNIRERLSELETEKGVSFDISYDNCNADANVLGQIIANFQADNVDLMIGVATPVAMQMQAATEESGTPVVFSAVSDPLATGMVESLEAPGANITGTSDYLDTNSVLNLIFAANPEAKKVGLLYDLSQDASTGPIEAARAYLDEKKIEYVERTGSKVDEIMLAADALIADGVDAIFTPTDNTVMTAELSIYEKLARAGIPHYTGADSFALNGAFAGYGVDYAELGKKTADLVAEILVDGKNPGEIPVVTFDNGTATINTETCELLGFDLDTIKAAFEPFCTQIKTLTTAESFE